MWRAFLKGIASIGEGLATFTIFPSPLKERYPEIKKALERSPEKALEADWNALQSDWDAVCGDLRKAMEDYEREQNQKRATKDG